MKGSQAPSPSPSVPVINELPSMSRLKIRAQNQGFVPESLEINMLFYFLAKVTVPAFVTTPVLTDTA